MGLDPCLDSESLVAEALGQHKNVVRYTHAGQNSQLDRDGTDFIIDFKCGEYFFPLSVRLQVKTSGNDQTVGVVLPERGYLSDSIKSRLTKFMLCKIDEHIRKHPHVNFMLFVSPPNGRSGLKKNQILEAIWKETQKMLKFVERQYIKKRFS